MNVMPKLSVIIPIYNVQDYLPKCLDSVLSQHYENLEIICVNDGSTDSSGDILKEYAQRDDRIIVIEKDNGGLVSARKAGISVATGQYATYVDSDDWIDINMYQDMMNLMINEKADLVTSGCMREYCNHTYVETEKIETGIYEGEALSCAKKEMVSTDKFYHSSVSIHIYNKIYRTDFLTEEQNRIPDMVSVGEDAACVYPYFLRCTKVVVSGKNYYHYRMRENSIMDKKAADEHQRYMVLFAYLEKRFKKYTDEIDNILGQLDAFKCYMLLLKYPECVIQYTHNYLYPYGQVSRNEKIVVYGNGRFGIQMITLLKQMGMNVVACVDQNSVGDVLPITELSGISYDKIIIAVLIYDIVETIEENLLNMGIPQNKIMRIKLDANNL